MAACQCTTPARRNRSSFATQLLADIEPDKDAAPLFIKSGEVLSPAPDSLVLKHARRLVAAHFRPGAPMLRDRARLREFLMLQIGPRDHEVFALILLDSRHRLIDYVELFHGTVDGSMVYARHVLECVIQHKATAVILVHNHPSGTSEPSDADIMTTERLRRALALIDVRVVDHLIVGEDVTSFVERGMLC
jgi:DNA repair protein RadC